LRAASTPLRLRVEPRFTEGDVELVEAWIGTDIGIDGLLMFGRMKRG
jgi:hypothetical protein